MRKLITLLVLAFSLTSVQAQTYPLVSVSQINTSIDRANCNDTSTFLGDTVRIRVHVVTDGGLSEVASGSVQGGNRPFIYMIDTAANGAATPDQGIEVMGVYRDASGNSQPIAGFTALFQGDKIEVTGIVQQFDGNTQFTTLDANSVTLLASGDLLPSDFTPAVVPVGDLNDNARVNNVQQGEQWQNSFVELQNVTVVQVTPFAGSRISFDVQDANGNLINVSDRFLAQRTPSHQVVNPNSPSTSGTGSFVPPSVGTFYTTLSGIVRHSANGCTGGTGRGYEINPFDAAHYAVGASAPNITNTINLPLQPTSADPITIQATITDADGSITSANIFYSTDPAVSSGNFTQAAMTALPNDNFEFSLPAQADGTLVRYYIEATDNDNSVVLDPVSPASATDPNFYHFAVRDGMRKIFDIQFSGNGTGGSSLEGQTVTVEGVVTAAQRDCDLEYVYIQDPSDALFSGIALIPNQDLTDLYRNQWVKATGVVQENFGVTYLNVTEVVGLNRTQVITPTPVDPSANIDLEPYEGMLIEYRDLGISPVQVEVSDADLGFGEYALALTGMSNGIEKRVLAGRQDGTRATSSLHVSLVSDTAYNTQNGAMQVPPIATVQGMTMDAMAGILWFSFGNYKLLPRNNFDITNLSVALDTNNCNIPTNVSVAEVATETLSVYPNPANSLVNLKVNGTAQVNAQLYNLSGSVVKTYQAAGSGSLNVSDLPAGVYLLKVNANELNLNRTYKIVVAH